jgi:hypothetical protein
MAWTAAGYTPGRFDDTDIVTKADSTVQAEFRKVLEPLTEKWRKAKPRNEYVYQAMIAEVAKVRAEKK